MTEAFASDLRTAYRNRGSSGVLMLWVRTLVDLVRSVAAERVGWTSGRRHPESREPQYQAPVRRSRRKVDDMLHDLVQDVRYAFRTLGRTPGFTTVAVLILALGIGANTTIFTLVNGLFLGTPPHVQEPERLVRVYRVSSFTQSGALAYPDFQHYRDNNEVFGDMYAYDPSGIALAAAYGDGTYQIRGWFVSASYFDVLGVRPALGRTFRPDEDVVPGTQPVVVLNHKFWEQSLGGDSSIVGRTLSLNGLPFTVIGVAPQGFRGASPIEPPPEVWMPITMVTALQPGGGNYFERMPGETMVWIWSMARLREGVTVKQAGANIDALGGYLAENFAEWNEGQGATVSPHYGFHPPSRAGLVTMSRLLFVVAALVLVIASANIAILLLARGSARRKEVGVRFALGARRSRVIRQFVTESLLLGAAGGVVGFAVAFWSAGLAATMIPLSFAIDFTPDWTVLGFAVAIAVGSGALFGVIPALQASRADAAVVIKEAAPGDRRSMLRNSLVVLQVALSVILVTGAALFGRSLQNVQSVELGFAPEDRLVVGLRLQNHGYDEERGVEFIRQVLERLSAVPGVRHVSAANMLPFRGSWGGSFEAAGVQPPDGTERLESGFNRVGTNYFETMEIPLVTGRGFTMQDDGRAPSVTVVNEAVAAMLWPGQEAVGRTITRGDVTSTVIGVARNATYYALGEDPRPQIYFPYLQNYGSSVNFIVHVAGAPMAMLRTLQAELHLVDPSVAFARVSTIDEGLEGQIGQYRVTATLVSLFGFLALVLASVGLYGVLSYMVVQSRRQIGIQLALGATNTQVSRLVVGRGVKLALVGIVLGTGVAFAASRFVASQLYGLSPTDPATFVAVPLLLIVVACVASIVPAGRAARVDPMVALRGD